MARSTKASGTRSESGRGAGRGLTATQILHKDHQTVTQLFARFEKSGDRARETKQRLFSEIERELEAHATIEEEIFYPAMQDEAPGAQDLVQEAIEEHNVVKSLLREIGAMSPEDEQYDAKMKVLQDNVRHHIEEEEGEMFPKAEQLPPERLQELGTRLQARKEALGQPTLKRIMTGVSDLIFGNGESTTSEDGGESGRRPRARSTRAASGRQRRDAEKGEEGRGETEAGSSPRRRRQRAASGRQGAGRRSAAKSTTTARGRKKGAPGRAQAQKRSSASAKKRGSGRSAEARGRTSQRRSSAKQRASAGAAGGRRRSGARKTASKRR